MTTHSYTPHESLLPAFLKPEGERPSQIWIPVADQPTVCHRGTTVETRYVYQPNKPFMDVGHDRLVGRIAGASYSRIKGILEITCPYAVGDVLEISYQWDEPKYPAGHELDCVAPINEQQGTSYIKLSIASIEATTLGEMTLADHTAMGATLTSSIPDENGLVSLDIHSDASVVWQAQHNRPWDSELWVCKMKVEVSNETEGEST